mmetsp:Transcript_10545/g.31750  ORF Transcript_10545/g.31750 Transcript_10545/m.31750 type:complete len:101 (-) Transcript_10545:873-1175(-)
MTCTLTPTVPTEPAQHKSRFHVHPLRDEKAVPRRKIAVNILHAALQEAAVAARSAQQEAGNDDAHKRMHRFLADACATQAEGQRCPSEGLMVRNSWSFTS